MSCAQIEAEQRLRARVGPLDAVLRVEHDHAVGNRLGGALEALDGVREVALVGASRARRAGRAPENATRHDAARLPGTGASSLPSAQRVSRSRWTDVIGEDRAPAEREHREAPIRRPRTPRAAPPAPAPPTGAAIDCRSSGLGRRMSDTLSARRGEPVAAAAHGLDQVVLSRTARAPAAGAGCGRPPCAPRCTRGRPTPGRGAARASARARGARAGSAAAGTRSGRAAPAARRR